MQITKLKIFGFKSFAQRTEINFPTKGLTAVVGPNGCGKSNITDAIRWVLGEQKAAALRMGKMQDVIFSGTEERAAMSLAEVSIVIDNSDGTLSSEYSEVIVTRRVHRDGSGEYLINNQECRLRDVHALLFDSGLGSSTYSQMNADMIKAVLSDKADDRRILFEEAAGVSKYRQQRKEAVRQLERVQQDMERVEDNLRSVRRSVRMYETQAEKVSEFKKLSSRLRELDLSVSLDKFEDYKDSLATLDTTSRRMNHEVDSAKTKSTELQTKIDEKKLAISEDENAFRDLERDVQKATIALNDINNNIMRLRDSITSLEDANLKAQNEIERNESKVKELEIEKSKLEEENAVLSSDSDVDEMSALLDKEREILQVMRDKLDDLRVKSRELSNERLQSVNKLSALKGKFERMDAQSDMYRNNLEKLNIELQSILNQKVLAESAIDDIQKGIDESTIDINKLEEQKITREERLEQQKTELLNANQKLQELINEQTRLKSRIDVLESVSNEGTDVNKFVQEHKSNLICGLISENIKATSEYVSLVELALGDLLDAFIVKNEENAFELLSSLENESVGKSLMALMGYFSNKYVGNIESEGVKGCLSEFVTSKEDISEFMECFLSRYFVVDSIQNAVNASKKYCNEVLYFVTSNAIVRTNGLISSGSIGSGSLSRKNEIEESTQLLENVAKEIESQNSNIESLKSFINEDSQILLSLVDDIREKNENIRLGSASIQIQKNLVNGFESRINQLQTEISLANSRINEANEVKNSSSELNEALLSSQKIEDDYNRVNEELSEQDILYREKDEEVRELERSAQSKSAKLAQNTERLRYIADQIDFLENSTHSRKEEIEKNLTSISKSDEDVKELSNKAESEDISLRELEAKRDVARERYEVVSGDLNAWRDEFDSIRDEMLDKMKELNEVGRRQEALQSNIDRIKERVLNEYSIDLSNPENVEHVEYSQPEADREIIALRGKIKELGPININVMEDYEDEKKRLEEVEIQFNDLDKARASLDRTISKLDGIARTRYLETFERIQKNFQFVFSKLFLNGETKMSLVEKLDENGKPIDILDADIEINVRPTGKKMRGIKALSGGEHALTATALLFAIYMEKPSPYCVLDEVDGPLDDANVGRFMALLREFSKQTLFIVVTHNKRTMAEADMLYGVTQEIKGISRIASVQLADATKFAI